MSVLAATPIGGSGAAPNVVRLTPEDLLRQPDDGRLYELVDGQLVEKEMSDLAQWVANRIARLLNRWADRTGAGDVLVEATFRCFPHDAGLVRRPDVAFIAAERLASYAWGDGHFTIAPDLAVEVVSPNDEVYELDRKLSDYFRAGVRRVWVINPEQKIARIHRAPGDVSELVGDAALTDDEVLPQIQCRLSDFFERPSRRATAAGPAQPPAV